MRVLRALGRCGWLRVCAVCMCVVVTGSVGLAGARSSGSVRPLNRGEVARLTAQAAARARTALLAEERPTAREVARVRRLIASREAARRRWLASPGARRQQIASRTAFRGLMPSAARGLLVADFGGRLRGLGASPAAAVAAAGRVLRYENDYAAVVVDRRGRKLIERSTVPLRTGAGPVDLRLVATSAAFAPVRAPESLRIARRSNGGITVGPGVRFVLQSELGGCAGGR